MGRHNRREIRNLRESRRRSITPLRWDRRQTTFSRSPSPAMTTYSRRENRDEYRTSESPENHLFRNREKFDGFENIRAHSFINRRKIDPREINNHKCLDPIYVDSRECFDPREIDIHEYNHERNARYASFDRNSRDRSRSPLSTRDYNRKSTKYDGNSMKFNSLDYSGSDVYTGHTGYTSNRGDSHHIFGDFGFDKQRRNPNEKYRGNHSRASDYLSSRSKIPSNPLQICKFYNNEGTCKNGQNCVYLHICKYFIKEECKFGNGCMRSHNVLDKQPRSILARYGMFRSNYNSRNINHVREMTRLLKAKLRDQKSNMGKTDISKRYLMKPFDGCPAAHERTRAFGDVSLLDQISDDENTSDKDCLDNMERMYGRSLSTDNSNCDTEDPSQTLSEDYIPLEQKSVEEVKTNVQKKRLNAKIKSEKREVETKKIKSENDETLSTTQDKDTPNLLKVSITFDLSDACGKFQVRKEKDNWQISSMGDDWLDLKDDGDIMMEDLCLKAVEVREIFDRMTKEPKLCNVVIDMFGQKLHNIQKI